MGRILSESEIVWSIHCQSSSHLTVNFPLTPYGAADSSPAGCSRAVWRERLDPARQAQPAKVLGPKLSFLQTPAQLSVQNPLLHFTENILEQNQGEVGEVEKGRVLKEIIVTRDQRQV